MNPWEHRFWSSVVRAARLERTFYADVSSDRAATLPTVILVALVALAHALGAIIRALTFGWSAAAGFLFGLQSEFTFWIVGSLTASAVGRLVFGVPASLAPVFRAFGFASAPGLLVIVAALVSIPGHGSERFVLAVIAVWRLAAGFTALRVALVPRATLAAVALTAAVVAGAAAVALVSSTIERLFPD